MFTQEQLDQVKEIYPDAKIIYKNYISYDGESLTIGYVNGVKDGYSFMFECMDVLTSPTKDFDKILAVLKAIKATEEG